MHKTPIEANHRFPRYVSRNSVLCCADFTLKMCCAVHYNACDARDLIFILSFVRCCMFNERSDHRRMQYTMMIIV